MVCHCYSRHKFSCWCSRNIRQRSATDSNNRKISSCTLDYSGFGSVNDSIQRRWQKDKHSILHRPIYIGNACQYIYASNNWHIQYTNCHPVENGTCGYTFLNWNKFIATQNTQCRLQTTFARCYTLGCNIYFVADCNTCISNTNTMQKRQSTS